MDADVGGGTVGLLPLDALNVDPKRICYAKQNSIFGGKVDSPELGPVALKDLADLLALVVTSHHLHLVVLPHRHGSDSILSPQLLGEGSGHEAPPDVGGGREVPLPRLGPVRGDVLIQFHLLKISHL